MAVLTGAIGRGLSLGTWRGAKVIGILLGLMSLAYSLAILGGWARFLVIARHVFLRFDPFALALGIGFVISMAAAFGFGVLGLMLISGVRSKSLERHAHGP